MAVFTGTAAPDCAVVGILTTVNWRATAGAVFDRYHIVSPADLQEVARKLAGTFSSTMAQNLPDSLPVNH